MKSYKESEKRGIGESDIALLTLTGPIEGTVTYRMGGKKYELPATGNVAPQNLLFGGDGDYSAYIVEGDAEIGDHYEQVAEYKVWMKIYDDHGISREFEADRIKVYRAGEYGCIIQLLGEKIRISEYGHPLCGY